ncbi:MAG: response regulator transcription factor [Colwellia sp.]|nr:response regulator transcription factor [Colwellia sp.]
MKNKFKVLIVENDVKIAERLTLLYHQHNFETLVINDDDGVIERVSKFKPDLILMDFIINNHNGLNCCQQIRIFSNVPIIILSAQVDHSNKHFAFECGVDDYLSNCFDDMELILRTKAILNRTEGNISFSKITIDQQKARVVCQGRKIAFSLIEYNLFNLLFTHPERIYSREQILQLAYPQYRHITDRTIDSHVKKIRNKFKEAGILDNPIESIYGSGYRFSLN